MKTTKTKTLFVTGMHRSGTSMVAQWLKNCGLDMGPRLIGATFSNVQGHFEDVNFVEFHEDLLRYNNTTMYANLDTKLTWTMSQTDQAKRLMTLRDSYNEEWGMKQPRASLFLNLWKSVRPQIKYLFLFRPMEEVVGSLFNREHKKLALRNPGDEGIRLQQGFLDRKNEICNNYLSMWLRHNHDVLDCISLLERRQYILMDIPSFVKNDERVLNYINHEWNFHLSYNPVKTIFDSKLLPTHKEQLVGVNWNPEFLDMVTTVNEKVDRIIQDSKYKL